LTLSSDNNLAFTPKVTGLVFIFELLIITNAVDTDYGYNKPHLRGVIAKTHSKDNMGVGAFHERSEDQKRNCLEIIIL